MHLHTRIGSLVAALAFLAPAVPASAAPPISIADGCSYKTLRSGFGFGNSTVFGHGFNFFTVTFTNNAAVTADNIVFAIDFGKASRIVIPDAVCNGRCEHDHISR